MADSAFGVAVAYEDTPGSATYTTVNGLLNLSGPDGSLDTIDVTDHQSTGGIRQYIGGLLDWGEIGCEINLEWDDVTHLAIKTTFLTRAAREWRITFTDAGTTTGIFDAIVTQGLGSGHPVDGKVEGSFTLKISGDITFA